MSAEETVGSADCSAEEAGEKAREWFELRHRKHFSEISVDSVLPIWSPDFSCETKSGQWRMRDRDLSRKGEDPWVMIPGRPDMELRSIGRSHGCTFYVPRATPKGARI